VFIPTLGSIQVTSNNRWITTLAARFGVTNGPWLFYGKAGGGWVGSDDFTVTNLTTGSSITVSNNDSPVETIPQLIAHAKANSGKLNFGAPTAGTLLLAGELFKMMAGVNIVHVAYRGGGGQAVSDLLAGRLQVSFDVMPTVIEYVRAGKLRGLAVTTAARSPALPDLPPVGDFVPGYEASSWHGIGVPKNTPADIVQKLNSKMNAALDDPKVISAPGRNRRCAAADDTYPIRTVLRRRNREVGQGGQVRGHQA
jgi:tripartite-type tricarboxylate transporter receptor subunit TctC